MTSSNPFSRRSLWVMRALVSGIFLVAGGNHLFHAEQTVQRLEQARFKGIAHFFGDPHLLVLLSGGVMLAAGLAFLAGFKTRWAAGILILVLIPITLTVQVGQVNTLGPLFKNIAILGALLFFVMNDTEKLLKSK